MLVWRVQRVDGSGPYTAFQNDYVGRWPDPDHSTSGRTPCPEDDAIGYYSTYQGRRFGFLTRADLDAWFTPTELAKLATLGFHPVAVEATDILRGRHQLAFRPVTALINPLPPAHPLYMRIVPRTGPADREGPQ